MALDATKNVSRGRSARRRITAGLIVGLRYFGSGDRSRLIAEGIETADELSTLRALDIGLGQGYLLGRPLPVDDA